LSTADNRVRLRGGWSPLKWLSAGSAAGDAAAERVAAGWDEQQLMIVLATARVEDFTDVPGRLVCNSAPALEASRRHAQSSLSLSTCTVLSRQQRRVSSPRRA